MPAAIGQNRTEVADLRIHDHWGRVIALRHGYTNRYVKRIVYQLLLGRVDRKWLICIFMTIGGVSLLCAMAIPTGMLNMYVKYAN